MTEPSYRIQAYAASTTNARNLHGLLDNGWRILFNCDYLDHLGRLPVPLSRVTYALDNGAWGAHAKGRQIDLAKFRAGVGTLGARADWVAAPDIVGGGVESRSSRGVGNAV